MSLTNYAPEVGVMKLGGIEICWSFDVWLRNFWLMCLNLSVLKPEDVCCSRTWQLSRASEVVFSLFSSWKSSHGKLRSWLLKLVEVEDGGEVRWCWTLGCWTFLWRLHFGFPCCVDWTCCGSRLVRVKNLEDVGQRHGNCVGTFSFFHQLLNSQFFNVLGKNWVNKASEGGVWW